MRAKRKIYPDFFFQHLLRHQLKMYFALFSLDQMSIFVWKGIQDLMLPKRLCENTDQTQRCRISNIFWVIRIFLPWVTMAFGKILIINQIIYIFFILLTHTDLYLSQKKATDKSEIVDEIYFWGNTYPWHFLYSFPFFSSMYLPMIVYRTIGLVSRVRKTVTEISAKSLFPEIGGEHTLYSGNKLVKICDKPILNLY